MSDSASARVTPFRAGNRPGESPDRFSPSVMPPDFGADVVLMADVSEFQPDIADAAYLSSFSRAIIIRAMYGGAHDDRAWYGGARRADLLSAGAQFLGIYQYVVASQDITAQATAFCRLLGTLNPGEYLIADIEEGPGSQQQRWQAWAHVVQSETGFAPADYSGLNFAAAHALSPVDWVAMYGTSEPDVPHLLWQFTDSFSIPGVGTADCSVFHGTIDQLRAHAYGGSQPAPPPPPVSNWTETLVQNLPMLGLTAGQHAPNQDVRTVQGTLGARGHAVKIDGYFGATTQAAVQAFQRAKGLAADGIVGPHTWTALLNR